MLLAKLLLLSTYFSFLPAHVPHCLVTHISRSFNFTQSLNNTLRHFGATINVVVLCNTYRIFSNIITKAVEAIKESVH